MLNIKERLKFHNRYDVQVIDATTNEIKQEAHAENLVLDGIWNILMNESSSYAQQRALYVLALGTGTGEPSSTDTGVFKAGATLTLSSSNTTRTSMSEKFPTSSYVFRINVPATSDYVGSYTEIAMAGRKQRGSSTYDTVYWSHALFKDAEGNPITITKTDLDVLVVTFTIYVTLGSSDDNFMWVHPRFNVVNSLFRSGVAAEYAPFSTYAPYSSSVGAHNRLVLCNCLVTDGQTIIAWDGLSMGNDGHLASVTNRTYTSPAARLGTTSGNGSYYHGIMFAYNSGNNNSTTNNYMGIGGVVFPNATVFPNRPIVGAAVGAGDGVTKNFVTPIPYFVEGTDKIYVDGVQLVRGTDYVLPSSSNYFGLTCLQPYRHMRIVSNGAPGGSLEGFDTNGNVYYTSRYLYIPFHPTANITRDPVELFNTSGPMVLELHDTAPVNRFNYISIAITQSYDIGGLLFYRATNKSAWSRLGYTTSNSSTRTIEALSGCHLVLETSMDNASWAPLTVIDLRQFTEYKYSSDFYYYRYAVGPFEPVTFKYLRVTFDRTNATNSTIANAYAVALHTFDAFVSTENTSYAAFTNVITMNDIEPPLKFVNPPAAGAVITMDATLNRPLKTDQHVIDMSMTLQL